MPKRAHIVLASIFGLLLAACATQPDTPTVDELAPEIAGFITTDQLRDDRGRFREIFCAVLEARERAASAGCTLLGMTGISLDAWPRRPKQQ